MTTPSTDTTTRFTDSPLLDSLDRRITSLMADYGLLLLRLALALIFLWFGVLKFFPGLSPAETLAGKTIEMLSFQTISASTAVFILAIWECAIGLGLLTGRFMRLTLLLLFLQMLGTITPLFLFPQETWLVFPIAPTLEGQYIIKNAVLIAGAVVLGATVRGGRITTEPPPDPADEPHR
jgi:uncharacterized membrane protein YphA (DoxX/SURF4 family)